MKKRIKILDTEFDKKRRIVLMKVEDAESSAVFTMVSPSDDFAPAMGFSQPLSDELLEKFCDMLKGKEKWLDQQTTINELDISNMKLTEEEKATGFVADKTASAAKVFDEMDRYPYHEILSRLQDEKSDR